MVKKILKEAIIIILLLVAIVLVVTVLFYDYIPTGKVVPVIEQYQTAENVKNEINEDVEQENSEIIVTYEIDNTDLKTYEKSKDYDKGKENPFAEYATAQENENNTNMANNTTNGNTINNSTSNNSENSVKNNTTNNNTGTKSDGTFFNSTKTK